jgi:hypothetical protein
MAGLHQPPTGAISARISSSAPRSSSKSLLLLQLTSSSWSSSGDPMSSSQNPSAGSRISASLHFLLFPHCRSLGDCISSTAGYCSYQRSRYHFYVRVRPEVRLSVILECMLQVLMSLRADANSSSTILSCSKASFTCWKAICSSGPHCHSLPFRVRLNRGAAMSAYCGTWLRQYPTSPGKDRTSFKHLGSCLSQTAFTFSGSVLIPCSLTTCQITLGGLQLEVHSSESVNH